MLNLQIECLITMKLHLRIDIIVIHTKEKFITKDGIKYFDYHLWMSLSTYSKVI